MLLLNTTRARASSPLARGSLLLYRYGRGHVVNEGALFVRSSSSHTASSSLRVCATSSSSSARLPQTVRQRPSKCAPRRQARFVSEFSETAHPRFTGTVPCFAFVPAPPGVSLNRYHVRRRVFADLRSLLGAGWPSHDAVHRRSSPAAVCCHLLAERSWWCRQTLSACGQCGTRDRWQQRRRLCGMGPAVIR